MSKETSSRVTGVEPHSGQQQVIESDAAVRVVAKGRLWGGTELIIADALRKAQDNPGITVWIIEPHEMMRKMVFDRLSDHITESGGTHESVNEVHRAGIVLENDSVIECLPTQKLADVGLSDRIAPEYIAVDEADNLPSKTQQWVTEVLQEHVEWRLLVGTPFGYAEVPDGSRYDPSWLYPWFTRGFLVGTGTESWRFPTSASPLVTRDTLNEMRQQVPIDVAAQEYDARWMQHPEMRA